MKTFLKSIKKYIIGFPCITKLENHYTEAEYRIFVLTKFGWATIFWKNNKCKVKNNQLKSKINSKYLM